MRPARCAPDRPIPSAGSGCRAFAPASWRRREWRQRSPRRACGNIPAEFVGQPMIDRLGASRAREDEREVDAKRGRRDRAVSDRQAPSAAARKERSAARPFEPSRRIRRHTRIGRHLRRSQFIGIDAQPRQSSHVPGPQVMNSVTTVNCALAAAHGQRRSAAQRAEAFNRAA
jgi:hypothetical protein